MNQFNEQCKQLTGQQMKIIQNYYQLVVINQKDKVEDKKDENKNNEQKQENEQVEEYINIKSKNIKENDLIYNRFSEQIKIQDSQLIYDCQFCPKLYKNNINLYWHTCQKHQQENQ